MNKTFYFLLVMIAFLCTNAFSNELYIPFINNREEKNLCTNAFSNELLHIGDFEYQEYSIISNKSTTKKGQVFFRESTLNKYFFKKSTSKKTIKTYSIHFFNCDNESSFPPSPYSQYFELQAKNITPFSENIQKYFNWETTATQDNEVLTKEIVHISDVAYSFVDVYNDWYTTISDIRLRFISQKPNPNDNSSSVKTRLAFITDTLIAPSDKSVLFPSATTIPDSDRVQTIIAILDSEQAQDLLDLFDENKIEEAKTKDISYKYQ